MTTEPFTAVSPSGDHAQPDGAPSPAKGSVRGWVRRVLGLTEPVPPRIQRPRELRTPAKDGGYDFTVWVEVVWTTPEDVKLEALRQQVGFHEASVWEEIETTVRVVARCFPPNQAAKLEEKLIDRLLCQAREWRPAAPRANDLARWSVRLRVDPDEAVKNLQQEFWQRRLEQAALFGYGRTQVEELRDLTARWRLFLGDLNVDDPSQEPPPYLAPYLARLAVEPSEAADTVTELARYQDKQNQELLKVVQNAIKTNQELNTYELLTTYESALARLLRHVGSQPAELGEPAGNGRGGHHG